MKITIKRKQKRSVSPTDLKEVRYARARRESKTETANEFMRLLAEINGEPIPEYNPSLTIS